MLANHKIPQISSCLSRILLWIVHTKIPIILLLHVSLVGNMKSIIVLLLLAFLAHSKCNPVAANLLSGGSCLGMGRLPCDPAFKSPYTLPPSKRGPRMEVT